MTSEQAPASICRRNTSDGELGWPEDTLQSLAFVQRELGNSEQFPNLFVPLARLLLGSIGSRNTSCCHCEDLRSTFEAWELKLETEKEMGIRLFRSAIIQTKSGIN